MIPLSWLKKSSNTSRDVLLHAFTKEMSVSKWANHSIDRHADTIRLATYNVHFWTDPFGRPNIRNILGVMDDLKADIIAFQEALMPASASIVSRLSLLGSMDPIQPIPVINIDKITDRSIQSTDGWHSNSFIDDIKTMGFEYVAASAASTTHSGPGTFFGNAIISTGHHMEEAVGVTLPPYGQGRCATIAFFPHTKIVGSKTGLIVVSVHLDVFDETGKSRRLQVNHLVSHLGDILDPSIPIIIMGDFNALKKEDYVDWETTWLERNNQSQPLDFQTIKELEKAGFEDVFDIQGRCTLKSTTWSARRVDYIFVKNIPTDSIFSTYAYYSSESDHIPLMVDLLVA